MEAVILGFGALFVLLLLQVPIAFGMAIVGTIGFGIYIGFGPALRSIGNTATDMVMVYDFSVLPLFILMGNFVARSGISHDLYEASNAWLGHRRGGLAMATVVACGGFSAVCGSSLATVATMSKVAIPSMRQFGYDERLATGAIAAGGTLGILIPPSVRTRVLWDHDGNGHRPTLRCRYCARNSRYSALHGRSRRDDKT